MVDATPYITLFMGKNVDDMSREEAIQALKVYARWWNDTMDPLLSSHQFYLKTDDWTANV